ncbi:hypothetical protein [Reyranella sp. CPCC 100927]|uniref:hypothetical protein n=1 Tax=Reyranella sp. CPCC 100927 TaxID=2599616 RepID=UPI0011B70B1C|nr:hypothetical protein [Reyranella sp. CPCC 100927]TWT09679.1 hypothetical protein FQU96_21210 [Reyranella sp. CPCC 100927]
MRPLILVATAMAMSSWHQPVYAQQPQQSATTGQPANADAAARGMAQRLGYCAAFFKPDSAAAQQFQFAGLLSQADAARFVLWFYFSASTAIPDQWRQPYEAARLHGTRDAASATPARIADVYKFCKPVTPSASLTDTPPAPTPSGTAPERLPAQQNGTMVRKLKRCWHVADTGGTGGPPAVHVVVDMAEGGRATDARLDAETQAQVAGSPRVRAFAAAALQAVLDPRCQPLPYPRDRYDQFRRFVLTFDPGAAR